MTRRRARVRGLTLLEVLVSMGILALIAMLIYGAFDGMSRARQGLSRVDERYHQGRQALARITRELGSAFVSMHTPLVVTNSVRTTVFVGTDSNPYDRIDFTSFSHRRMGSNVHESDQNEISYFSSHDPEHFSKVDLARREQKEIDLDPQHGGAVNVAAEDIVSFDVTYLDQLTATWVTTWDTTQATGQPNRLPMQVKVVLVMKGGLAGAPVTFETKVPIAMQTALGFAIPH